MNLDRCPKDEFPIHPEAIAHKDAFGIEIELEGANIRTEKPSIRKYWSLHEDGSLRAQIPGRGDGSGQTCEYVSQCPLPQDMALESTKVLFEYLNSKGVTVFPSYRTSIHVHVNCAAESWRTVYNFITLSIIFDELFVSQNGEHRIGNNFCLRFIDAEAPIKELAQSVSIYGNIYELPTNMRYSSINFASLRKFGTIEFRSMECHTDYERFKLWLQTLQKLKEAARTFQTPQDIINLFSQFTELEFGDHVLKEYFKQFDQTPGVKKMLRRGMRLAQDFAYSATWEGQTRATELELQARAEKQKAKYAIDPNPWGVMLGAPPAGAVPLPPVQWGGAPQPAWAAPGAGAIAQPLDHPFPADEESDEDDDLD